MRESRRRSPESSRRRRADRRHSREQLAAAAAAAAIAGPSSSQVVSRAANTRARADSSTSASSSTSSSLVNISRPTRFGIRSFFTRTASRKRVRKRPSFRTTNSSRSSFDSDLAYGKGYVSRSSLDERDPRPGHHQPHHQQPHPHHTQHSHYAQGPHYPHYPPQQQLPQRPHNDDHPLGPDGRPRLDRAQTDEEIRRIGRQLSDLARAQNVADLERAGRTRPNKYVGAAVGTAAALYAFNRPGNSQAGARGIGSSRPKESDDEDWESASDSDSSDDVDSGLAYGSMPRFSDASLSLPPSMAPIPGQPSIISERPSEAIRPPGRKSSAVDPALFGPVNSLHGCVTPFGYRPGEYPPSRVHQPPEPIPQTGSASIEARPMRQVYPVPTTDPNTFEATAGSSGSVPQLPRDSYGRPPSGYASSVAPSQAPQEAPLFARPEAMPIQAPKPRIPVSPRKLEEKRSVIEQGSRRTSEGRSVVESVAPVAAAVGAAVLVDQMRKGDGDDRRSYDRDDKWDERDRDRRRDERSYDKRDARYDERDARRSDGRSVVESERPYSRRDGLGYEYEGLAEKKRDERTYERRDDKSYERREERAYDKRDDKPYERREEKSSEKRDSDGRRSRQSDGKTFAESVVSVAAPALIGAAGAAIIADQKDRRDEEREDKDRRIRGERDREDRRVREERERELREKERRLQESKILADDERMQEEARRLREDPEYRFQAERRVREEREQQYKQDRKSEIRRERAERDAMLLMQQEKRERDEKRQMEAAADKDKAREASADRRRKQNEVKIVDDREATRSVVSAYTAAPSEASSSSQAKSKSKSGSKSDSGLDPSRAEKIPGKPSKEERRAQRAETKRMLEEIKRELEREKERERLHQESLAAAAAAAVETDKPSPEPSGEPPASSSEPAIDPFQYQVSDSAFQTPDHGATPARPLTPAVITAEPKIVEEETDDELSRRDSRLDKFEKHQRIAAVRAASKSDSPDTPIEIRSVSPAPEPDRKRDSEPVRDTVQEEANRAYRQQKMAAKQVEEEIRSRSASPEPSVVGKWNEDVEEPVVRIVTPPEMKRAPKKSKYDGPNADVRIDNVILPHHLPKFTEPVPTFPGGPSLMPVFKSRDPSAERERPLLNLVMPTPRQTPSPEIQRAREAVRNGDVHVHTAEPPGLDDDEDDKPKEAKVEDEKAEPKKEEPKSEADAERVRESALAKLGLNKPKKFSWGAILGAMGGAAAVGAAAAAPAKDEAKADTAEGKAAEPSRDLPPQSPKISPDDLDDTPPPVGPKPSSPVVAPRERSVPVEPVTLDTSVPEAAPAPIAEIIPENAAKEKLLSDPEPTPTPDSAYVDSREQPASPPKDVPAIVDASPKTVPRELGDVTPPVDVPGAFGEDIELAATVAAGLKHTGFDDNMVIENLDFRRRDSPPGLNDDMAFYKPPSSETVTDLGVDEPGQGAEDTKRGKNRKKRANSEAVQPLLEEVVREVEPVKEEPTPAEEAPVEEAPIEAVPEPQTPAPEASEAAGDTPKGKKKKKKNKKQPVVVQEADEAAIPDVPKVDDTPAEDEWSVTSTTKSKGKGVGYDDSSVTYSGPASEVSVASSASKKSKKNRRKSAQGGIPEGDEPPDKPGDPGDSFQVVNGEDVKDQKKSDGESSFELVSPANGSFEHKDDTIVTVKENGDEHSFLASAGTLGAGVGETGAGVESSAVLSRHQATLVPVEEEEQEEKRDLLPLPQTPRRGNHNRERSVSYSSQVVDPEILDHRIIKPAIDPLFGDLLPLPPSEPGSPTHFSDVEYPPLPGSRPDTPPQQQRARGHSRHQSWFDTPIKTPKTPSGTAVPIHFRVPGKSTPSTPIHGGRTPPSAVVSSPAVAAAAASDVVPGTPSSRPRTSWRNSREIKPLFLLEKTGASALGAEVNAGTLPELPPSEPPSSCHESEVESGAESEAEGDGPGLSGLMINMEALRGLEGVLGSGETTPRAEAFEIEGDETDDRLDVLEAEGDEIRDLDLHQVDLILAEFTPLPESRGASPVPEPTDLEPPQTPILGDEDNDVTILALVDIPEPPVEVVSVSEPAPRSLIEASSEARQPAIDLDGVPALQEGPVASPIQVALERTLSHEEDASQPPETALHSPVHAPLEPAPQDDLAALLPLPTSIATTPLQAPLQASEPEVDVSTLPGLPKSIVTSPLQAPLEGPTAEVDLPKSIVTTPLQAPVETAALEEDLSSLPALPESIVTTPVQAPVEPALEENLSSLPALPRSIATTPMQAPVEVSGLEEDLSSLPPLPRSIIATPVQVPVEVSGLEEDLSKLPELPRSIVTTPVQLPLDALEEDLSTLPALPVSSVASPMQIPVLKVEHLGDDLSALPALPPSSVASPLSVILDRSSLLETDLSKLPGPESTLGSPIQFAVDKAALVEEDLSKLPPLPASVVPSPLHAPLDTAQQAGDDLSALPALPLSRSSSIAAELPRLAEPSKDIPSLPEEKTLVASFSEDQTASQIPESYEDLKASLRKQTYSKDQASHVSNKGDSLLLAAGGVAATGIVVAHMLQDDTPRDLGDLELEKSRLGPPHKTESVYSYDDGFDNASTIAASEAPTTASLLSGTTYVGREDSYGKLRESPRLDRFAFVPLQTKKPQKGVEITIPETKQEEEEEDGGDEAPKRKPPKRGQQVGVLAKLFSPERDEPVGSAALTLKKGKKKGKGKKEVSWEQEKEQQQQQQQDQQEQGHEQTEIVDKTRDFVDGGDPRRGDGAPVADAPPVVGHDATEAAVDTTRKSKKAKKAKGKAKAHREPDAEEVSQHPDAGSPAAAPISPMHQIVETPAPAAADVVPHEVSLADPSSSSSGGEPTGVREVPTAVPAKDDKNLKAILGGWGAVGSFFGFGKKQQTHTQEQTQRHVEPAREPTREIAPLATPPSLLPEQREQGSRQGSSSGRVPGVGPLQGLASDKSVRDTRPGALDTAVCVPDREAGPNLTTGDPELGRDEAREGEGKQKHDGPGVDVGQQQLQSRIGDHDDAAATPATTETPEPDLQNPDSTSMDWEHDSGAGKKKGKGKKGKGKVDAPVEVVEVPKAVETVEEQPADDLWAADSGKKGKKAKKGKKKAADEVVEPAAEEPVVEDVAKDEVVEAKDGVEDVSEPMIPEVVASEGLLAEEPQEAEMAPAKKGKKAKKSQKKGAADDVPAVEAVEPALEAAVAESAAPEEADIEAEPVVQEEVSAEAESAPIPEVVEEVEPAAKGKKGKKKKGKQANVVLDEPEPPVAEPTEPPTAKDVPEPVDEVPAEAIEVAQPETMPAETSTELAAEAPAVEPVVASTEQPEAPVETTEPPADDEVAESTSTSKKGKKNKKKKKQAALDSPSAEPTGAASETETIPAEPVSIVEAEEPTQAVETISSDVVSSEPTLGETATLPSEVTEPALDESRELSSDLTPSLETEVQTETPADEIAPKSGKKSKKKKKASKSALDDSASLEGDAAVEASDEPVVALEPAQSEIPVTEDLGKTMADIPDDASMLSDVTTKSKKDKKKRQSVTFAEPLEEHHPAEETPFSSLESADESPIGTPTADAEQPTMDVTAEQLLETAPDASQSIEPPSAADSDTASNDVDIANEADADDDFGFAPKKPKKNKKGKRKSLLDSESEPMTRSADHPEPGVQAPPAADEGTTDSVTSGAVAAEPEPISADSPGPIEPTEVTPDIPSSKKSKKDKKKKNKSVADPPEAPAEQLQQALPNLPVDEAKPEVVPDAEPNPTPEEAIPPSAHEAEPHLSLVAGALPAKGEDYQDTQVSTPIEVDDERPESPLADSFAEDDEDMSPSDGTSAYSIRKAKKKTKKAAKVEPKADAADWPAVCPEFAPHPTGPTRSSLKQLPSYDDFDPPYEREIERKLVPDLSTIGEETEPPETQSEVSVVSDKDKDKDGELARFLQKRRSTLSDASTEFGAGTEDGNDDAHAYSLRKVSGGKKKRSSPRRSLVMDDPWPGSEASGEDCADTPTGPRGRSVEPRPRSRRGVHADTEHFLDVHPVEISQFESPVPAEELAKAIESARVDIAKDETPLSPVASTAVESVDAVPSKEAELSPEEPQLDNALEQEEEAGSKKSKKDKKKKGKKAKEAAPEEVSEPVAEEPAQELAAEELLPVDPLVSETEKPAEEPVEEPATKEVVPIEEATRMFPDACHKVDELTMSSAPVPVETPADAPEPESSLPAEPGTSLSRKKSKKKGKKGAKDLDSEPASGVATLAEEPIAEEPEVPVVEAPPAEPETVPEAAVSDEVSKDLSDPVDETPVAIAEEAQAEPQVEEPAKKKGKKKGKKAAKEIEPEPATPAEAEEPAAETGTVTGILESEPVDVAPEVIVPEETVTKELAAEPVEETTAPAPVDVAEPETAAELAEIKKGKKNKKKKGSKAVEETSEPATPVTEEPPVLVEEPAEIKAEEPVSETTVPVAAEETPAETQPEAQPEEPAKSKKGKKKKKGSKVVEEAFEPTTPIVEEPPMVEEAVEPTPEPAAEPIAEPGDEPFIEPVVEPVAEDPVAEDSIPAPAEETQPASLVEEPPVTEEPSVSGPVEDTPAEPNIQPEEPVKSKGKKNKKNKGSKAEEPVSTPVLEEPPVLAEEPVVETKEVEEPAETEPVAVEAAPEEPSAPPAEETPSVPETLAEEEFAAPTKGKKAKKNKKKAKAVDEVASGTATPAVEEPPVLVDEPVAPVEEHTIPVEGPVLAAEDKPGPEPAVTEPVEPVKDPAAVPETQPTEEVQPAPETPVEDESAMPAKGKKGKKSKKKGSKGIDTESASGTATPLVEEPAVYVEEPAVIPEEPAAETAVETPATEDKAITEATPEAPVEPTVEETPAPVLEEILAKPEDPQLEPEARATSVEPAKGKKGKKKKKGSKVIDTDSLSGAATPVTEESVPEVSVYEEKAEAEPAAAEPVAKEPAVVPTEEPVPEAPASEDKVEPESSTPDVVEPTAEPALEEATPQAEVKPEEAQQEPEKPTEDLWDAPAKGKKSKKNKKKGPKAEIEPVAEVSTPVEEPVAEVTAEPESIPEVVAEEAKPESEVQADDFATPTKKPKKDKKGKKGKGKAVEAEAELEAAAPEVPVEEPTAVEEVAVVEPTPVEETPAAAEKLAPAAVEETPVTTEEPSVPLEPELETPSQPATEEPVPTVVEGTSPVAEEAKEPEPLSTEAQPETQEAIFDLPAKKGKKGKKGKGSKTQDSEVDSGVATPVVEEPTPVETITAGEPPVTEETAVEQPAVVEEVLAEEAVKASAEELAVEPTVEKPVPVLAEEPVAETAPVADEAIVVETPEEPAEGAPTKKSKKDKKKKGKSKAIDTEPEPPVPEEPVVQDSSAVANDAAAPVVPVETKEDPVVDGPTVEEPSFPKVVVEAPAQQPVVEAPVEATIEVPKAIEPVEPTQDAQPDDSTTKPVQGSKVTDSTPATPAEETPIEAPVETPALTIEVPKDVAVKADTVTDTSPSEQQKMTQEVPAPAPEVVETPMPDASELVAFPITRAAPKDAPASGSIEEAPADIPPEPGTDPPPLVGSGERETAGSRGPQEDSEPVAVEVQEAWGGSGKVKKGKKSKSIALTPPEEPVAASQPDEPLTSVEQPPAEIIPEPAEPIEIVEQTEDTLPTTMKKGKKKKGKKQAEAEPVSVPEPGPVVEADLAVEPEVAPQEIPAAVETEERAIEAEPVEQSEDSWAPLAKKSKKDNKGKKRAGPEPAAVLEPEPVAGSVIEDVVETIAQPAIESEATPQEEVPTPVETGERAIVEAEPTAEDWALPAKKSKKDKKKSKKKAQAEAVAPIEAVVGSAAEPIIEPVAEAVDEPAVEPVTEPTTEAIDVTLVEAAEPVSEAIVEVPIETPEPISEPASEPTAEPATHIDLAPVEPASDAVVEAPVETSTEPPAVADLATDLTAATPVEPIAEPVSDTVVDAPVEIPTELVTQPASEVIVEAPIETVAEPPIQPTFEPADEVATEPTEQAEETWAMPAKKSKKEKKKKGKKKAGPEPTPVEPEIVERSAEPVIETVEPVAEPVAEAVTEPVADVVSEPALEPTIEAPAVETLIEAPVEAPVEPAESEGWWAAPAKKSKKDEKGKKKAESQIAEAVPGPVVQTAEPTVDAAPEPTSEVVAESPAVEATHEAAAETPVEPVAEQAEAEDAWALPAKKTKKAKKAKKQAEPEPTPVEPEVAERGVELVSEPPAALIETLTVEAPVDIASETPVEVPSEAPIETPAEPAEPEDFWTPQTKKSKKDKKKDKKKALDTDSGAATPVIEEAPTFEETPIAPEPTLDAPETTDKSIEEPVPSQETQDLPTEDALPAKKSKKDKKKRKSAAIEGTSTDVVSADDYFRPRTPTETTTIHPAAIGLGLISDPPVLYPVDAPSPRLLTSLQSPISVGSEEAAQPLVPIVTPDEPVHHAYLEHEPLFDYEAHRKRAKTRELEASEVEPVIFARESATSFLEKDAVPVEPIPSVEPTWPVEPIEPIEVTKEEPSRHEEREMAAEFLEETAKEVEPEITPVVMPVEISEPSRHISRELAADFTESKSSVIMDETPAEKPSERALAREAAAEFIECGVEKEKESDAVAAAVAGVAGVALAGKIGGKKKKKGRKGGVVDKRTEREDVFDDAALWEGAEKRVVEDTGGADVGGFWGIDEKKEDEKELKLDEEKAEHIPVDEPVVEKVEKEADEKEEDMLVDEPEKAAILEPVVVPEPQPELEEMVAEKLTTPEPERMVTVEPVERMIVEEPITPELEMERTMRTPEPLKRSIMPEPTQTMDRSITPEPVLTERSITPAPAPQTTERSITTEVAPQTTERSLGILEPARDKTPEPEPHITERQLTPEPSVVHRNITPEPEAHITERRLQTPKPEPVRRAPKVESRATELGRQDSETVPRAVREGRAMEREKKQRKEQSQSPEPVQRSFSFPDDIADEEAFTTRDIKADKDKKADAPMITLPRVSSISDFMRSVSSLPPVQEEMSSDEEPVKQPKAKRASRGPTTPNINRDSGFSSNSPHVSRHLQPEHEGLRDSGVHLESTPGKHDGKHSSAHSFDRDHSPLRRSPLAADVERSVATPGSRKLGPGTPRLREPSPPPRTPEPEKLGVRKRVTEASTSTLTPPIVRAATGGVAASPLIGAAARSVSDQSRGPTRSTPDPTPRRSASNTSLARLRTPEPLRPDSPGSLRSFTGTPPLRRVDRRVSGDLRSVSLSQREAPAKAESSSSTAAGFAAVAAGAAALGALGAIASSSNNSTTPVANEGRARTRDMTDVFDGFGEGRIGSPRSPTRPHSMRRRQSMQVLELENRVDQLLAENRALADAQAKAESQLTHSKATAVAERDTEIESLRRMLHEAQDVIERLKQTNEGLRSSTSAIAVKHHEEVRRLETANAQTSKELDAVRGAAAQHAHLVHDKDREIASLRAQLEASKEEIIKLQEQILRTTTPDDGGDFLDLHDVDYFDHRCQQLCAHVQQWVLRFSKFSDMRACRLTSEINDEKLIDRLDNAVLDGSDVDVYLSDRVRRRDIFMSMTTTMIWEFVFTRYLFGMDREQRQKLKTLEKQLLDVGPPQAVRQWRAITLTLLSRRPSFKKQRDQDTEAVVQAILDSLGKILPPPSNLEDQIQTQLRRVVREAVGLAIEMRCQKAEYMMLPPLQPEYDDTGELTETVTFNAALMNERSGDASLSNEDLETAGSTVRVVLFPLVVRKGDENGVGEDEIVVCPAQVLVAKPSTPGKKVRMATPSSDAGGVSLFSRSPAPGSTRSPAPGSTRSGRPGKSDVSMGEY
ncbi:hypothetical protein OQA88_3704 [Cercophora sp. LCS_1]